MDEIIIMKIVKYSLGQLQANCYFLIEGQECLVIDPGDEANFILEELQRQKLHLIGVMATHGHFDHIGAVGEIQLSFNVPLHIFIEDQFLVDRLNETAKYFLGFNPHFIKPKIVNYLNKKKLTINNYQLSIIHSSGHTPGSCCFYIKEENAVFTGDTLFKDGIGRYDFSYSNKKDLKQSLEQIFKLPEETTVYSGHGEETNLHEEKNTALHYINIMK
ncbi:MAG: Beta-lactamase domain protein [Candidatus Roizmanbacteria bacterium GW2011_GWA2_34_18]|uniref:Beta-lactamase domain protein n=1 Tax=Candidatus Roizmanbacteria bacterium GW2011_GWA2_34_18 TaxID=1618477 RepID=A0A0G0DCL9_9BACT|nr:MAG: Beta-lactamase domain protein [Candidatus Roizmanbacteria bacterium GW2011_GWA2_34_18]